MNDHHFSYPVVVPLRGTAISGHATTTEPPAPVALRPVQAPIRNTPAPATARLAA
jgi:hypothetical protein